MILTVSVLFVNNAISEGFHNIQPKFIALLSAASFMFFVGLIDDIRGLRAITKLSCQLAAATFVCAMGIRITSINVPDLFTINFGWFSWPITILWIVGITNAINLIDGLDGLAAGISAIACGVIAILSIYFGQVLMAVTMLSLLGALSGFLVFNLNPAKIFMGDCGSLFLGFYLATSSVLTLSKSHTFVGLALPVLALGVPIFDTLFSMLRRFLERRSMFAPDSNHFHHTLVALGFHQRHVVIIMYIVTLLASGLGFFMLFSRSFQSIIIFGCVLLLLILAFSMLGVIRLRETILRLKQKYAVTNQMNQEKQCYEEIELHFRQAQNFKQWWSAICFGAEQMDITSLSLTITRREGANNTLTWKRNGDLIASDDLVKTSIPIHDRRNASPLELEIKVHLKNGLLESAGRRLSLLTRLLEKHDLSNLSNENNKPLVISESANPEHLKSAAI